MDVRLVILMLCALHVGARAACPPGPCAIRAGKIVTMADGPGEAPLAINHGIMLIKDGKIEAIGPDDQVNVPAGYTVIDASDRWVMPGIVEAHTHIGAIGGFNDMLMPLNPELRVTDGVNPEDFPTAKALAAGITTLHTMPGSGTNLGGFTVIMKTAGSSPEEMILRELGAMKATQAYNPERRGGDLGATRMGMSWMLRYILKKGQTYHDAWQAHEAGQRPEKPAFKPEYEQMRQVFAGRIPVIVHTYDVWGLMQTVRMFHDEFGLKTIPTHTAYSGHLIADKVGTRENVHVNIGPRLYDFYRAEGINRHGARQRRFYGMGARYHDNGVTNLSINTDAVGFSTQEELFFQAAMSARLGLDDLTAMKAITINAARALGIEDRVGSLEVGKDADIVIKKAGLLDVTTPIDWVLVDGRIAYRRHGVNLLARQSVKNEVDEPEKPS